MNRQSGNILFIIFIGIALFAALAYVVSSGMRGGTATIGSEKANILVSEFLTQMNQIATTTRVLKAQGCSDNQISFQGGGGSSNPNSPLDNSCHVFHQAGGGLPALSVNRAWQRPSAPLFGVFDSAHCVYGVGSGNSGTCTGSNVDLLFVLFYASPELCTSINKQFDINPPTYAPPTYTYVSSSTSGNFESLATGREINPASLYGKRMGCFYTANFGGMNAIYATLLAR